MYSVEAYSKAGRGKKNEDCHGETSYEDGGILVVLADGMGDTDCAADAASIVVKSVLDCFGKVDSGCEHSVEHKLERAVLQANARIADACLARGCRMGCAAVVAYIHERTLWYVSLGNVRVYLHFDDDRETCITKDDVYVASNGNVFLSRSLSGKELEGRFNVNSCSLEGVKEIVLATDGEYNHDENDDATRIVVRKVK